MQYNQKVNLTNNIDPDDFYLKNVRDSLGICKCIDLDNYQNILDLGSGGGFPGLILAIVFPRINFYLNETNGKKLLWLKYITKKLKLTNIKILEGRIENLKGNNQYQIIIARAVAKTSIILEISINKLAPEGLIILYKGKNYSEEVKNMEDKILNNLDLKYLGNCEWVLTPDIMRFFLKFKKGNSKNIYPIRQFGEIKDKPLF